MLDSTLVAIDTAVERLRLAADALDRAAADGTGSLTLQGPNRLVVSSSDTKALAQAWARAAADVSTARGMLDLTPSSVADVLSGTEQLELISQAATEVYGKVQRFEGWMHETATQANAFSELVPGTLREQIDVPFGGGTLKATVNGAAAPEGYGELRQRVLGSAGTTAAGDGSVYELTDPQAVLTGAASNIRALAADVKLVGDQTAAHAPVPWTMKMPEKASMSPMPLRKRPDD